MVRISNGRPIGWRRVGYLLAPLRLTAHIVGALMDLAEGAAGARRFASCGENVSFDPKGVYTFESIHLGSNVTLGMGACLIATRSTITVGDHVMFGPNVTVRGGNHRIDMVGRYLDEVGDADKLPENDPGVVIEDDTWIGQGAILLAGVRIGRGSIVGAGAVVATDVPPYSVVGGVPARVLRARFTDHEIIEHERRLDGRKPSK